MPGLVAPTDDAGQSRRSLPFNLLASWNSQEPFKMTRTAPLHFKGTDTMKLDIQRDRERADF